MTMTRTSFLSGRKKTQETLGFGGKLDEWKILGQTKMQEPGKDHKVQTLGEVMDAAWKIGSRVRMKTLTGKLHMYWVSSRKPQKQKNLQNLVYGFRAAMSGKISKTDAQNKLEAEKRAEADAKGTDMIKVDVRHMLIYLSQKTTKGKYMFPLDKNYEFTYVGPECTQEDNSILPLSDLLPRGIFAGWA